MLHEPRRLDSKTDSARTASSVEAPAARNRSDCLSVPRRSSVRPIHGRWAGAEIIAARCSPTSARYIGAESLASHLGSARAAQGSESNHRRIIEATLIALRQSTEPHDRDEGSGRTISDSRRHITRFDLTAQKVIALALRSRSPFPIPQN